jgi:predicted RNA methylase
MFSRDVQLTTVGPRVCPSQADVFTAVMAASSAFIPAQSDVPSYMLPMLNDADRNLAYESAIKETIAKFTEEQGRAPHVLDLGAGTGLLSLIALKHEAARVTALEANETVQGISAEQIEKSVVAMGRNVADFELINGLSIGLTKEEGSYDIVISELLGSMINSESQ